MPKLTHEQINAHTKPQLSTAAQNDQDTGEKDLDMIITMNSMILLVSVNLSRQ